MFSNELENLIQATLEDGVLEDYEKAALVRRAQAEGVDLAELEIYINSILQRRQKEIENEKKAKFEKHAQDKREALGQVCPNCGKQVPPMTLKCECGFEFTKGKSVSSVQLLFEKIKNIQSAPMSSMSPNSKMYKAEKQDRLNLIREAISLFPVPNTKEDIIEFLSLSASKSKQKGGFLGNKRGRLITAIALTLIIILILIIGVNSSDELSEAGLEGLFAMLVIFPIPVLAFLAIFCVFPILGVFYVCLKRGVGILEENKTAEVWREKFNQVILKGRSMRGDSDFQRQLDYYENFVNQK